MGRYISAIAVTAVLLVLGYAAPASAQSSNPCTENQAMAVRCFVNSAVATKILTVPAGMTTSNFDSYAVAVLRISQDTNVSVILLGTTSAIADAMPPKNASGAANDAAQTNAVSAIVNAELSSGIIALPKGTTAAQLELFAKQAVQNMSGFTGVSLSPGGALRLIDSYIVTATNSGGKVDWTEVNSTLTTAVKNLTSTGLLKLPSGLTQAQFTTFVENVAQAIAAYKTATGRKSL